MTGQTVSHSFPLKASLSEVMYDDSELLASKAIQTALAMKSLLL